MWSGVEKTWYFSVDIELVFHERIHNEEIVIRQPGPKIQNMETFLKALESGIVKWAHEREDEILAKTKEAQTLLNHLVIKTILVIPPDPGPNVDPKAA